MFFFHIKLQKDTWTDSVAISFECPPVFQCNGRVLLIDRHSPNNSDIVSGRYEKVNCLSQSGTRLNCL